MEEKNNKLKISAIVLAYNGEKYLAKALNSVLNQTYPVHELIVIDDGSTDRSAQILDGFSDRIIRKRIDNSGISKARNIGMHLATGDYIAFLDQDDIWFKNKLEKIAQAISKYPQIGLLLSNYAVRYAFLGFRMVRHFSILKTKGSLNYNEPLKIDPFKLLLQENFLGAPSFVVFKKKLIDEVGLFNPKYVYVQDYDYWLRIALKSNFVILPDILGYKKLHQNNLSNNLIESYSEHRLLLKDTFSANSNRIKTCSLLKYYKQSISEVDYLLAGLYLKSRRKIKALKFYCEGLLFNPSWKNILGFMSKGARKIYHFTFGKLKRPQVILKPNYKH